ncbi:hypothetical protein BDR26DRAFT_662183 [Obelidium mucronatum]|nr:hypothetical protein BDR26DRAFT_662183 [Obelidium mucronatum]
MGGYTMGLSAKAPGLLKNRLASDLTVPMGTFGDPDFVDLSPEHRTEMKTVLYGAGRTNRATQNSYTEVGAHAANYADERPPPWISTHTTDYPAKSCDRRADIEKAKEYTEYIKSSHFSLDGYGAQNNPTPISTTKRDFDGTFETPERRIPPRKTYPPIYRDERQLNMGSSEYNSTFIPRVTHAAVIAHPDSSGTHFTLGDDVSTYKSITKSTFGGFGGDQPRIEIIKDKKKRSTVLDNPDGEPGETVSVQKADYTIDPSLDRKTLKVDNTMTVKDLKSTHFTLGNDELSYKTSQYQSTFQRPPASYVNDNLTSHVNHYQTFVNMKDEDDVSSLRVDKLSTQHRDYRKLGGLNVAFNDGRHIAEELKFTQKNSCIVFGNDDPSTRSITKSDFSAPTASAYPSHLKTGILNAYSPISGSRTAYPFTGGSVMKSSYVHFCDEGVEIPEDGSAPKASDTVRTDFLETFNASRTSGQNLRGHHFSLGTDEGMNGATSMKTAYQNPGTEEYKKYKMARAGMEWRFDSTLENTVTRYPKDSSTFQTVSDVTYIPHDNHIPPKAFKPATVSFLTISAADNEARLKNEPRLGGMLLSTETKRKFVPPEVMTYESQRLDLVRS